jgi:hypothetical protein
MDPIHTHSTIFALLTGQDPAELFEYLVRSAAGTKGKYSPSSRVNLECTSEPAGKASIRQQAAGKGYFYKLPER